MIRTRWTDHIRILAFAIFVPRSHDRRAVAIAVGQRFQTLAHGVDFVIIWVAMLRRIGRATATEHLSRGCSRNPEKLLNGRVGGRDGMSATEEQGQIDQGSSLV